MPSKPDDYDAFRSLLRQVVLERFGASQTAASKAMGFSQGFLSELLSGKRNPGRKVLRGVTRACPDLRADFGRLIAETEESSSVPVRVPDREAMCRQVSHLL